MNYETTVFLENYYYTDGFTNETSITYSRSYSYSDSTTALSTSWNGASIVSSTLTFSTNFSSSASFVSISIDREDGQIISVQGENAGSYDYDGTSTGSFTEFDLTLVSDIYPNLATTFFDGISSDTYLFENGENHPSFRETLIETSSYNATSTTSTLGSSTEIAASVSSFSQTIFVDTQFVENWFSLAAVFTDIPTTSSTSFNSFASSFSQNSSYERTNISPLYISSYVCSSRFPVQFWYFPDPSSLDIELNKTDFQILSNIGALSATSFTTKLKAFEYVFPPTTETFEDSSFSSTIGVDSDTFTRETVLLIITSTDARKRDGSLSSSAITSNFSTTDTFSYNGTVLFHETTNQNASYYDKVYYKTIFQEYISDILLINGTTNNFLNFEQRYYQTINQKIPIGNNPLSLESSSFQEETTYSAGNYFSSAVSGGLTSYSPLAAETTRLFRRMGFISTSPDWPIIFDITYNGGFCAFSPENSNIYKNLVVNKKSGDGEIFINETEWASICPNIKRSLASYNFTSFVKDCWTYSTIIFSETFIKNRSVGFIDSTFSLTTGGIFTVSSDGRFVNLGGKKTTLSIETNDTLASYFSYSQVNGSYLTQIMELKLSDQINDSEKTSWTTFQTNSSYYQFNTNGKLALYPGGGYFLTLKKGGSINYRSIIINPISEPTFLSFDKGDGFAITTAPLFAKGAGSDVVVIPNVYFEDSD